MAGVQVYTESPISPAVQRPQRQSSTLPVDKVPQQTVQNTSEQSQPLPDDTSIPTSTLYSSTHIETGPSILTKPNGQRRSPMEAVPTTSSPSSPADCSPLGSAPQSRSPSPRRDIPPPPKNGEKLQPASYYSPISTPTYAARTPAAYPPNITSPQAPQHIQSPSAQGLLSPQSAYRSAEQAPNSAGMARQSLEHPPGYVQNPHAADLRPEQIALSPQGSRSPILGDGDGKFGAAESTANGFTSPTSIFGGLSGMVSPGKAKGGILNGDGNSGDESVWGVVGGWVKGVGKKMGEVEGEVWRRINGE